MGGVPKGVVGGHSRLNSLWARSSPGGKEEGILGIGEGVSSDPGGGSKRDV